MKAVVYIPLLMLIAATATAQHTIGLRIGDPMTVNYKYYFKKPWAVEAMAGISLFPDGATRVSDVSEDYDFRKTEADRVYVIAARFLYQLKLPKIKHGDLGLYFGGGPRIHQIFQTETFSKFDATQGTFYQERSFLSAGFEVISGIEYRFEKVPIIIFGEPSWGLLFDGKSYFYLWAGVGARYVFASKSPN